MTKIIGFSGKKQSGKDTLLNNINPMLHGTVKKYSFADGLKNFLVDVMGLSFDQVWGTDEQKNSLTEYKWENLPEYMAWDFGGRWYVNHNGDKEQIPSMEKPSDIERAFWITLHETERPIGRYGFISARELMQIFGTDICRRMFGPFIWVNSTFRTIVKDNPDFAIISDLRFPSELEGVKSAKGLVVRLQRDVSKGDQHPSEIALDNYNWSELGNSVLLVPANFNIEETKTYVWNWLSNKVK